MWNAAELAEFRRHAAEAREIARTIFDKGERLTLLAFLDGCEKMAADKHRRLKPL